MELEHETFKNAKAANLYKASMLKKVGPVGWAGRGSASTLQAACPPPDPRQSGIHPPPKGHLYGARGGVYGGCGAHCPSFASWRYFWPIPQELKLVHCPVVGSHGPQKRTWEKPGVGAVRSLWVPWRACLSLSQVAEIHQASKDGKLYDMGGSAKSCSAQAEPPEPTEYDIRPASQVYSVSGVHPKLGSRKGTPSLCPQLGHSLSWHHISAPRVPQGRPSGFPALPSVPLGPTALLSSH